MRAPWIGVAVCLVGLACGCWLFFAFEWVDGGASREKMLHELFKFTVTTVLVGGAALFYDAVTKRADARHEQSEKERDEREADIEKERATRDAHLEQRRELDSIHRRRLEKILIDVTDAYNLIKFTRREIRNALEPHINGEFLIDCKRYCDLLRELNRGQLKLEQFRRILESKPTYLLFIEEKGAPWISSAEKYLRKVTREYENRRLERAGTDPSKLVVDPRSRLYQYVISTRSEHHDGTSVSKYFNPLDNFFRELARGIESI